MRSTSFTRAIAACIGAVLATAIISCGGGGGGAETGAPFPGLPTPPSVPENVRLVQVDGTRVNIAWDAVPNAVYRIYRLETPESWPEKIAETTSTSFTDSGLDENTVYYYKVSACNGMFESPGSESIEATTGTGGSEPIAPLRPMFGTTTTESIHIVWHNVTGAKGYRLYRSNARSGPYTQTGDDLTLTNHTDTGLEAGTTYFYRLKAYNDFGESDMGAEEFGITQSASAPGTPAGLAVGSATSSSLGISWNSVPGAEGYRLYRSTSSGGAYSQLGGNLTATSFNDTGLAPSTTYYYKVSAYNAYGESSQSAYQSGATTSGGSGGGYRVSKAEHFNGAAELTAYSLNTYDSSIKDRVIRVDNYDKNSQKTGHGLHTYDGSGNLTQTRTYDASGNPQGIVDFTYNASGYGIEKMSFRMGDGSLIAYSINSYNGSGEKTKTENFDDKNVKTSYTDYTYSGGVLQSDKMYLIISGSETIALQQEYSYTSGSLSRITQKDSAGTVSGYVDYTYNTHGLEKMITKDKNLVTTGSIKYTYESY